MHKLCVLLLINYVCQFWQTQLSFTFIIWKEQPGISSFQQKKVSQTNLEKYEQSKTFYFELCSVLYMHIILFCQMVCMSL